MRTANSSRQSHSKLHQPKRNPMQRIRPEYHLHQDNGEITEKIRTEVVRESQEGSEYTLSSQRQPYFMKGYVRLYEWRPQTGFPKKSARNGEKQPPASPRSSKPLRVPLEVSAPEQYEVASQRACVSDALVFQVEPEAEEVTGAFGSPPPPASVVLPPLLVPPAFEFDELLPPIPPEGLPGAPAGAAGAELAGPGGASAGAVGLAP